MNLLTATPAIGEIINKVIPDPNKRQELSLELAKIDAQETVARLGVLQSMLGNKGVFVAGGIPALIWVGVAAIFNNYVLLPWAGVFGATVPNIELPQYYWLLLGAIISGVLGKKAFDENEIWRKDGTLLSPSKLQVKEAVAQGKVEPVGDADARLKKIAKEKGLL